MKLFTRTALLTFVFILLSLVFFGSAYAVERNNDPTFDIITNIELTDRSDQPLNGTDYPKDTEIKLTYHFEIPGGAIDIDDAPDIADHFTLEVPSEVEVPAINGMDIYLDGSSVVVATLDSIPASNQLVLTFTPDAFTPSGIVGNFWFYSNFDENNVGMTEPVEISFDIGQVLPGNDITYNIDFEQPPLQSSKQSSSYDPVTKRITWQIDVNESGLVVDDFGIIDSLPDEIDFVDGTLEIDGGTYVVNPADYSYDDTGSPKILTYNFPAQVTQAHTITYQTTVSDAALNAAQGNQLVISNSADMTVNGFPMDMNETPALIPINVMEKSVATGGSTRETDWTIDVNQSLLNINGASVTDTIPLDVEVLTNTIMVDGVQIFSGTGVDEYQLTGVPSTGETLTINLGDITGAKQITYTTRMTDAIYYTQGSEVLTNSAVLSPDPTFPNHQDSATITPNTQVLRKTGPSYDRATGRLSWVIYVNPHEMGLTNVVVTDTIPTDQTFESGTFYVTDGDDVAFDVGNTGLSFVGGNDFFTYTFPASITDDYIIRYETQVVDSDVYQGNHPNVTFDNDVTMSYGEGTDAVTNASQTVTSEIIEKNDDGYDYTTRYMSWVIQINENQNDLTGVVVNDAMSADQDFVAGSFKIYRGDETTGVDVTGDAGVGAFVLDAINDEFEYTFVGTINETYTITFQTEFVDLTQLEQNATISINNEAIIDHTGISPPDTSQTSGDIVSEVISKSDNYTTGQNYINWEIVVNRNEIELTDVVVTDVLPLGLELETTSIELWNLDLQADNSVVETTEVVLTASDIAYDLATRTLDVTFPATITTAYKLKFRSYVVDSGQDPFNNYVKIDSTTLSTEIGYNNQVDTEFAQYGGSASGDMGSITIIKEDSEDSNVKLQGAVFELLDKFDMVVREVTTDSNGEAFFDRIVFGQPYTIREKTPPTGYNPNAYVHSFTIVDAGANDAAENISFTYTDDIIKGDLTFIKVGETSNPLQGATFTIFETDGTNTGLTAVSAADGTVTFVDIPYGNYYVQETIAPTGYDINSTQYSFSIINEAEVVTLTPANVVNTLSRGDITLRKVDEASAPIQGAVFSLYDAADTSFSTPLATETSAADGILTFADRLAGNYVVREESVPDGYVVAATISTSINIDGDNVDLGDVQNDYIQVVLDKVTQGTSALITTTADFRLYSGTSPSGVQLEDIIMQTGNDYSWNGTSFDVSSGTAGRIVIEALDDGDYYFEEISAPVKYDMPTGGDEITSFTVSDSNQTLTVENTPSESILTLTKTDGLQPITSNPAEFRIYNSADDPILLSGSAGSYTYSSVGGGSDTATLMETATTGIITISNLLYDDYYFIEVDAPYGYEEDSTTHHSITVDADTESLEVSNVALPTSDIAVTKTDGTSAITNNAAGFMVYTSLDEPVLVTGSAGNYTFDRIAIGTETATQMVTSSTGSLNISDTPIGDYYFVETSAPTNYILDSTTKHSISVDGVDDTISVANTLAAIYSLGDYVWIDEDRDGVQDDGEIPVDNVTVTLFDDNDNQIGDPVTTGSGSWDSGYYRFSDLTVGRYYVVFSNIPGNYVFTSSDTGTDDTDDSDANTTTGVSQTVLVDDTTTTNYHYPHLDAGIHSNTTRLYSLGDYVWIDEDEDGAQDSNEVAVNNVAVKLFDSSGTQIGSTVYTGDGNWADGYYEFTGLTEGDYYVEFSSIPVGYDFTGQNIGDDTQDSDANINTGRTAIVTINDASTDANGHYPDLDAGIYLNPESANVHVYAKKMVNGDVPLECEQFGFTITKTDLNGNVITGSGSYSEAVYNEKANIDFNLHYDESDIGNTYYYKIKEQDTKLYGYTIDSSVIDIEVRVYQDGDNIATDVVRSVGSKELTSDYTFNNSFAKLTEEEMEEQGVDPIFTVTKTVDGKPVSQREVFSFKVEQVDINGNTIAGGFSEVVQNNATGYAEFSQILYYAEDIGKTYYYKVSEIAGSGDYVYDTSQYTATIEITNDDPSTPAVVTVVMRDENGVQLSRAVIADQGLEVRVPSVSFNNLSKDDGSDGNNNDKDNLPDTATYNYLWIIIAIIGVVLASFGFNRVLVLYNKQI